MGTEKMEDVPGSCRFNADGDLEQLREVKVFDEEGQLTAIEQRWVLVPTVA